MTRTSPAHTLADFADTITRMDALSQSGFSAIAAIARRALEAPQPAGGTQPHTEDLRAALWAILEKAEFFGNEGNVRAEQSGCNWVGKH